ncbi:MAG: peptidoglycan-binding protein [Candidatus Omnitrophica bacterium]|nr:peptidoglycan-binding protein [Candidatus Omnitrophota bacterium]
MSRSMMFRLLSLVGISFLGFGCATKAYVSKQVNPVQSQVAVLTEEVAKMDEALQDVRGSIQSRSAAEPSVRGKSRSGGARIAGGVYRTPSGFELPSLDIQTALKGAGYYHGNVDGKIGPGTEAALRAFQKDNGLEADGLCGQMTWVKLKSFLSTIK